MKYTRVLETKRLYLRHLVSDDFENLYPILSDQETMGYYPAPFTPHKVRAWIQRNITSYRENGHGLWAVIRKEQDLFIGECGITRQVIDDKTVPEVGYHIAKRFWNQGYATEAAFAVMEYGFSVLKLPALYTYTSTDNVPSQRVAIKNGMNFVKTFQKEVMGTKVEEVLFSLSAEDFFNQRKESNIP